jgi:hypothetical protein
MVARVQLFGGSIYSYGSYLFTHSSNNHQRGANKEKRLVPKKSFFASRKLRGQLHLTLLHHDFLLLFLHDFSIFSHAGLQRTCN